MLQACKVGLPTAVAQALPMLEFEARKDAAQVCSYLKKMDSVLCAQLSEVLGTQMMLESPHKVVLRSCAPCAG